LIKYGKEKEGKDAGDTRQGMGRQRHGDFFATVDPKNCKRLKKEEVLSE
jgi:hypothetical protein